MNDSNRKHAFTLVELSVVLVIIGLVIGGISAGQSLLHQAQIKSVMNDVTQFKTAINIFKLQYNFLPGDFNNAKSFWPSSGNGNGDGYIQYVETVSGNGIEDLRAWEHLSLAGVIPQNIVYNGFGGPPSEPGSKIPSLYYHISYEYALYGYYNTNSINTVSGLSSLDAYNIDLKMDDGIPYTGTVLGLVPSGGSAGMCVTTLWYGYGSAIPAYVILDPNNYKCRVYFLLS